jgi:two-component system phosphate regulon response regulator PhoB
MLNIILSTFPGIPVRLNKAETMSKQILIIEDDEDILQVLETVLVYNEFEVTGIDGTEDIYEAIEKYKPDLVLTDYLLSGLNGGKICQLIKSNKETCHLPVVLISAYPELAISFGNFGFDAFINKPFNIGELVDKLDELLEKSNKTD